MAVLWDLAEIATKLVLYLGVLAACGTVFAARVFGADLGPYKRIALSFALPGFIASVIMFSLNAVTLTGEAAGMADPEILDLLWGTPSGVALVLRSVGLGLLVVGVALQGDRLILATIGAFIAIGSFTQVGHVSGMDVWWLNGVLVLHLIGISFWIGVLIPLRKLALTPGQLWRTADLGQRFGWIALIAVPVLIGAGGYLGYRLVGSVGALISTGYGQVIIVKIMLVAVLLTLGAANKLRYVPRMRDGDRDATIDFARTISREWMAILAILLVTSVLTTGLTLPN